MEGYGRTLREQSITWPNEQVRRGDRSTERVTQLVQRKGHGGIMQMANENACLENKTYRRMRRLRGYSDR
jgi:hypothetical protein